MVLTHENFQIFQNKHVQLIYNAKLIWKIVLFSHPNHSGYKELTNILTNQPILFKCGMMQLWGKRNIHRKLNDSRPLEAFLAGSNCHYLTIFDHFSKFFPTSAHLKKF